MRKGQSVASLCLLVGVAPTVAFAEKAQEPIRLAYEAPISCGSQEAFLRALRENVNIRDAKENEPARMFRIHVVPRGEAIFRGSLRIVDREGRESSPRELELASCEELMRALQLSAALAIDPELVLRDKPPPPDPVVKKEAPKDPDPSEPTFTRFSLGAGWSMMASGAPGIVHGPNVFGQLQLRNEGEIRLHLELLLEGRVEIPPVHATFLWAAGRIDTCPVSIGRTLRFLPCIALRAGILRGEGAGTTDARNEIRPWVEPGLRAMFRWEASKSFQFSLDGGIGVPLLRPQFSFDPALLVYEPPAVVWSLGTGLSFSP